MTSLTPAGLRALELRVQASPVKVMVVDDSAIARGFIRRWTETEADIEIVGIACSTAREALSYLDRAEPDVVVLDIEMPDMDGITALPLILAKKPNVAVIIASDADASQCRDFLEGVVTRRTGLHPETGCAGAQ